MKKPKTAQFTIEVAFARMGRCTPSDWGETYPSLFFRKPRVAEVSFQALRQVRFTQKDQRRLLSMTLEAIYSLAAPLVLSDSA